MEAKLLRTHDGVLIVDISGELDLYNAPKLRSSIEENQSAMDVRGYVFNMTHASYIDSSGIGVLLNLYTTARKTGKGFCLCGVGGSVEKVLSLTRLNSFFPRAEKIEDAVKKASSGVPL